MSRPAGAATPGDPATIAELRRVAVHLAETAAAHVRLRRPEVFGPDRAPATAVQAKSTPTDPVTVVDTETEDLVRRLIGAERPGEQVLGEEGGGSIGGPGEVVWVVDPIDGTVNFLYGLPAYAVSVAAMRDGQPLAGAVADVARGIVYHAGLGAGAVSVAPGAEPVPLRCTPVTSVAMALVSTGFAYRTERRARQGRLIGELLPRVRDIRRVGSAALDLCMVASGQVDATFEHGLNTWDWAAGALIAAEAGARLRLPAADSGAQPGELVAAVAPGIADELFELFDRLGVTEPIPVD
nr:inositol monophosphatase family protein [Nocardia stercoris]